VRPLCYNGDMNWPHISERAHLAPAYALVVLLGYTLGLSLHVLLDSL